MRVKVRTEYKNCHKGSFCSEIEVSLVRKRAIYVIYKISDSKDRQKNRQNQAKIRWKFFPKKGYLKIWSAKSFSVLLKLGAKSPPMGVTTIGAAGARHRGPRPPEAH